MKVALLTASDYYRDYFFNKYVNGKDVPELNDLPVEPQRDLSHFIKLFRDREVGETDEEEPNTSFNSETDSKPTLKHYKVQHPKQNSDLQKWIEDHRILTKSSSPLCSNGKGADFMQEEDLKLVLGYLPKSTLLNSETFNRAVRLKQYFEDLNGCKAPERKRGYDKYEIESQVVGLVLMRNGFTNPQFTRESPYSNDLLEIPEIFQKNLKTYFTKRVEGFETSGLKMTHLHFTKSDKVESQKIEKKTKQEILEMIIDLVSDMEDEDQETVKGLCSKSRNKQFLINQYQELLDHKSQAALNISNEDPPET